MIINSPSMTSAEASLLWCWVISGRSPWCLNISKGRITQRPEDHGDHENVNQAEGKFSDWPMTAIISQFALSFGCFQRILAPKLMKLLNGSSKIRTLPFTQGPRTLRVSRKVGAGKTFYRFGAFHKWSSPIRMDDLGVLPRGQKPPFFRPTSGLVPCRKPCCYAWLRNWIFRSSWDGGDKKLTLSNIDGWWFQPSEKILVTWDHYSQKMRKYKCSKPPARLTWQTCKP